MTATDMSTVSKIVSALPVNLCRSDWTSLDDKRDSSRKFREMGRKTVEAEREKLRNRHRHINDYA